LIKKRQFKSREKHKIEAGTMILDDNNQHGREWEKNDKGNLFVVLNFTILSFEKLPFFANGWFQTLFIKKRIAAPFIL